MDPFAWHGLNLSERPFTTETPMMKLQPTPSRRQPTKQRVKIKKRVAEHHRKAKGKLRGILNQPGTSRRFQAFPTHIRLLRRFSKNFDSVARRRRPRLMLNSGCANSVSLSAAVDGKAEMGTEAKRSEAELDVFASVMEKLPRTNETPVCHTVRSKRGCMTNVCSQ